MIYTPVIVTTRFYAFLGSPKSCVCSVATTLRIAVLDAKAPAIAPGSIKFCIGKKGTRKVVVPVIALRSTPPLLLFPLRLKRMIVQWPLRVVQFYLSGK